MFVDGVDRFDVNKGKLNNSWFLAAVTNLAEDSEAFLNVVPKGQGLTEEETNGTRPNVYRCGRGQDSQDLDD